MARSESYHLDEARRVKPALLTKIEAVLNLYTGPAPAMMSSELDIYFHSDDVDKGLFVRRQDWVDMGMPETVTVTIEAGDQLNG